MVTIAQNDDDDDDGHTISSNGLKSAFMCCRKLCRNKWLFLQPFLSISFTR